ncbi:MAG: hypothetical protein EPGJADBJ_04579 [Saprospiraceae bacterium]|nr:hypothetical protein [Saprospiraceae bacterium]
MSNVQKSNILISNFQILMKFKHFLCLCLPAFFSATTGAQATVNWATDIAPILYENCVKCHRDGGIGHFSLIGYGNAAANSFAVMNATRTRKMPPWKPDPSYRRFAHERRLTDEQIQTIQDWVFAGSPAGDLNQAPPDPVFVPGSNVGTPDHVLTTPLYTVTATEDEYRCFVIPNGLNQAAYLRGLEAIPGNHEVVHHILIYEDTTGQAQVLDSQTPEPGYVNFGGTGVNGSRLIGAWVPGSTTILTPPFMGMKLTPGADLIVQMHYPKGVTGMSDMTTLNFFFTPANQNIREIRLAPLINHTPLSLENWPLFIPANQVKTYHAKFQVPIDGAVLSVAPHMHLIGRSMVCFAVTPQNDTIPLIRINDWDFHWQGGYFFQKIQKVPANSTVHAYAAYDNTTNNPFQPSDPPQLVTQGEATTDEMMLVYFAFLEYQPGDEDIVLDSTLLSTAVPFVPDGGGEIAFSVFPNPVSGRAVVEFEISETADIQASILDLNGRSLKTFAEKRDLAPGIYRETADLSDLPPGVYVARIHTSNGKCGVVKVVKDQ